jgi:YVTN family beta-propeller protein
MLFAAAFWSVVGCGTEAGSSQYGFVSPLALATDSGGTVLYIAEHTARQVVVFDIAAGKVAKAYPLPDQPTGLAVAPDGARLYVTGASPLGKVYVIDLNKAKIVRRISAGHTPNAPVVSPDGRTLYVCNRFNNSVSVINIKSGRQAATIDVVREPVAAAITPDGKLLYVANLLPAGRADQDYAAAAVSVIDTTTNSVAAQVQLPNGSMALRGVCTSPDGRHIYVTHVLARYQLPTTQLERGWMNTNALSVIDATEKKLINTVLLDDVDLGAANPWAVACTADGKYICVTHAGTHELSVIDRAAMHEKLTKVAAGERVSEVSLTAADVPNDLSFLVGLRRRLKLSGNGPRSLAIIGTKAYTAEYFSDSLGIIDVDPEVRPRPQSIALGPNEPMTVARKGEMLFHDAMLCFQHWQSCSTCHPDARADGLNWDLLNDGMGNPKNTKSMLLAHQTPPAMVTGIRTDAETAVRAGIRHIQFAVRPEEDAVAIDEYLNLLEPIPGPYLVKGWLSKKPKLSKAARRGKKVFKKAGCISCHSGPLGTDLKQYDVGTGKGREQEQAFDTPALVEVWRTAPYLNDGRAVTIKDMLVEHNVDDKHGRTSGLTQKQIADLTKFVLSR